MSFKAFGAKLMFGLFGRRKRENSIIKGNPYFIRCATFDDLGDQIMVIDPDAPRVITMEPWLQIVFLAADGKQRISSFVKSLSAQYKDGAPEGLEKQVHEIVRDLLKEGIIRLIDEPEELPYYLSMPSSQLDMDKAKKLMEEDGFIKSE
jgi:hypothetical protein